MILIQKTNTPCLHLLISAFKKTSKAHNMAPLAQWAIQILSGSLYAEDYVSSGGTQWQVTTQATENLATSPVGSIGLTAASPSPYETDVLRWAF